jgi:thioredoxin 1
MAIVTLTDSNFTEVTQNRTVLLMVTNGEDKLRGDFKTEFVKSADEYNNIIFGEVNPNKNPAIAEYVNYQNKSLMIGWYDPNDMIIRRSRPWGTDLPGAIQTLQDAIVANAPQQIQEEVVEEVEDVIQPIAEEKTAMAVLDKPMNVTDVTFEKEAIEASHDMPVLIDFWAEWCGPCRMVAPILDKLAGEFAGQIRIVKVDTDANPGLSQAFQIRSIPSIAIFKQGKMIFMQPGALPEPAFRDLIQQAIDVEIPEDEPETEQ